MEGRTSFVVAWMCVLFLFSWFMSLSNYVGLRFWDEKYVLDEMHRRPREAPYLYNSTVFADTSESYFTPRRYHFLLPHILGAILWWNLYFLQLIPSLRRNYKTFHKYLGRCLLVVALVQMASGMGMAYTSHSAIIKIVSYILGFAVLYCICKAWTYAYYKDIPRHKYWVMKLVGYLQTIALQRFWLLVLIISHQSGFHGLYPSLENATQEEANQVVYDMFDGSFVLSVLFAILTTEWYLAGESGLLEQPGTTIVSPFQNGKVIGTATPQENFQPPEVRPLLNTRFHGIVSVLSLS